ncbi:inositol monophosphatase [bacterium]|nr:MAG: inositol monophosphatase [bacterium]
MKKEQVTLKQFLLSTTLAAGRLTRKMFGNFGEVCEKSGSLDLVTEADKKSNELFYNRIKKMFPDHGIVSEEIPAEGIDNEYVWVIDPLDGTLNYRTGVPCYAIIAALKHKGQTLYGAVYDPIHNEMFFAEKGKGAFKNGSPTNCSAHDTIRDSIGLTNDSISFLRKDFFNKILEVVQEKSAWASSLGCTGVSCNYIADGRKHWYICSGGGGVWDYAGTVLLLEESGCLVTDLKGEPWETGTGPFVAANPILHKQLIEITKTISKPH